MYLSFDLIIEIFEVGKMYLFLGGVYFDDKKFLFNILVIKKLLLFEILIVFLR